MNGQESYALNCFNEMATLYSMKVPKALKATAPKASTKCGTVTTQSIFSKIITNDML